MIERRKGRKRPLLAAATVAVACLVPAAQGFSSGRRLPGRLHRAITLRYADPTTEDSAGFDFEPSQDIASEQALYSRAVEVAAFPPWLARYEYFTSSTGDTTASDRIADIEYALRQTHGLPIDEVQEILRFLHSVAGADGSLARGLVTFVQLVLELENGDDSFNLLVSKDFLMASIIHYTDCIALRRSGIPDVLQSDEIDGALIDAKTARQEILKQVNSPTILYASSTLESSDVISFPNNMASPGTSFIPALAIAHGAAKLKRAEVLAQTMLHRRHLHEQELRDLLLTVMEDWRSLALRCIACLFRLEGIIEFQKQTHNAEATPEIVHTSREALRIFAVLAERLGMHRLKARIEERAFSILYKRQHRVINSIYHDSGLPMDKLSDHLLRSVVKVLQADQLLMAHVEDLQVTSRVKEPFSFWKKILKRRLRVTPGGAIAEGRSSGNMEIRSSTASPSLSINDIHDSIALRVVLRARKATDDESGEITRDRERLLCYYVQQLLRNKWPEYDPSRVKDYIAFPKPNGYQSLHHASMVTANGINFPFEIQIRSEEMHRFAEFGLAAHWDYKLAPTAQPRLPSASVHGIDAADASTIAGLLPPASAPLDAENSLVLVSPESSHMRYIEALNTAKERVQSQLVYVFLMDASAPGDLGRLVSVPVRSSLADVVATVGPRRSVAPNDARATTSVWRNGKLAQPGETVENGDFIMVSPMAKGAKPALVTQ